jgi:hypothetical protein
VSDRLVCIWRYSDSAEASLDQQKLEAEGIRSFLGGARASDAYAGLFAVANTELLVAESDAERAKEVLELEERRAE